MGTGRGNCSLGSFLRLRCVPHLMEREEVKIGCSHVRLFCSRAFHCATLSTSLTFWRLLSRRTSFIIPSMLDLKPSSILVFVFAVLLLKTVVNTIGKVNIENYAWNIYTGFASKSGHPQFVELRNKRAELVEINKQRKAISAQDQYAKWTKLNRQFDKVNGEVAALTEAVSSEKLRFTKTIGVLISLGTAAPVWFSRVWYRKAILFYFPPGVLPHYLEWVLALPFITTGGVGLTIWMMAVNSVLASLAQIILFYILPAVEQPTKPEQKPTEKTE